MRSTMQQLNFHEDAIFIIDHDGEPFVPVRPICENIGLDWKTQHRKLMSGTRRFSVVMVTTQLPGDQQRREVVCIHLKKVAAWLNSIEPNRVAPHLKDKIERYQDECDEVLWNYWTKGVGLPDRELTTKMVIDKDLYIELLEDRSQLLSLRNEPPTGAVSEREIAAFKRDILAGYGTRAVARKHLRAESTVRLYTVEERLQAGTAVRKPGSRKRVRNNRHQLSLPMAGFNGGDQ